VLVNGPPSVWKIPSVLAGKEGCANLADLVPTNMKDVPTGLRIQPSSIHKYANEKHEYHFPGAPPEGTSGAPTPMGVADVCAAAELYLQTNHSDQYYYHNGVLKDGPYEPMTAMMGGMDANLNLSVFNPNRADPFSEYMTQVWVGSPGVTTHLHYDVCDNFFMQLKGAKRFVLASSSYHDTAQLYPAMHPNGRQSQHNLTAGDPRQIAAAFAGQPFVYDAILQPGHLLFTPGYVFHMVEAQHADVSVSVSTFSKSHFNQGYQRMIELRMPAELMPRLENSPSQVATMRRHLTEWIGEVVSRTYKPTDTAGIATAVTIGSLLYTRSYKPLFERLGWPCDCPLFLPFFLSVLFESSSSSFLPCFPIFPLSFLSVYLLLFSFIIRDVTVASQCDRFTYCPPKP
jgi:hypothetical protein